MKRCGLVCVLLVAGLAWGQAGNSAPAKDTQQPVLSSVAPTPHPDIPPDAPVITIPNLCDYQKTHKVFDRSCKTTVTRAKFDWILQLTDPNAPPKFRHVLGETYANTVIKTQIALQQGLDKSNNFASRVEVLRLLFYAQHLDKILDDEEWNKVTDKEIADYYNSHPKEFYIADVTRIFLPRFPPDEVPGEQLTDAQKAQRQKEWDQKLKDEADSLRARAVAGGDFMKLQDEAYKMAGVHGVQGPEDVTLNKVRRRMFDDDQKSVMDMEVGQVSPVLYDETRGYCIFRIDTKSMLPLDDHMKAEIHKMYQTERVKADKDAIQNAAKVTFNEAYMGPPTPEDDGPAPAAAAPSGSDSQTAAK